MKQILQNIQTQLSEIEELKYIDEDWGQIDYYSPNMPVKWPCCLIDIQSGQFTNISKDFSKNPKDRQRGSFAVKITLANLKLSNTSFRAWRTLHTTASRNYFYHSPKHPKSTKRLYFAD